MFEKRGPGSINSIGACSQALIIEDNNKWVTSDIPSVRPKAPTVGAVGSLQSMFYLTKYRGIKKSLTLWSIILIVCFFFLPSEVLAGEPTEQVRQSVEAIRSVFRNKELSRPENKKERNAQLRRIVEFRFDFEEMSKRSLSASIGGRGPRRSGKNSLHFTKTCSKMSICGSWSGMRAR